jgi:exonuclease SbcC
VAFRAVGSIWGKWDLHFHTPASFDYDKKNVTNEQIVEGLVAAGVEVVAITDHHTMDVDRIKELQTLGSDKLTVLPGIEFRSELGGSETVHYIGIFPENADVADLWTKLSGKLEITAADVQKKGDDKIYVSHE